MNYTVDIPDSYAYVDPKFTFRPVLVEGEPAIELTIKGDLETTPDAVLILYLPDIQALCGTLTFAVRHSSVECTQCHQTNWITADDDRQFCSRCHNLLVIRKESPCH